MNLANLDANTLGFILNSWRLHDGLLNLWLTGNKLLQLKIVLGVTKAKFKNVKEFAFARMPSFIQELTHLRSLTVCRTDYCLLYPNSTGPIVYSLPQSLVTLKLQFGGSTRLLFPNHANTTSTPSELVHWSIKSAFPVLETLCHCPYSDGIGWNPSMFSELPSTLTRLQPIYQRQEDIFKSLMEAIPSSIRVLEVIQPPVDPHSFLSRMTDKPLTTLICNNYPLEISGPQLIQLLPRSLTYIGGDENLLAECFSQGDVSAFPTSLTKIKGMQTDPEMVFRFDHFTQLTAIKRIGPSDTPSFTFDAASVKRLPPTLRTLHMTGDIRKISKTDWPPHLTELKVSTTASLKDDDRAFDTLPLLTTFELIDIYPTPIKMISALPKTLTSLKLVCRHLSDVLEFPPNLKHLSLSPSYREWIANSPHASSILHFPLHLLPRSLETFACSFSILASQLVHMPPRLTTLCVAKLIVDADFNPNDPQLVARTLELVRIGVEHGIPNVMDPNLSDCTSTSVASLLPRTLTVLTVWSSGSLCRDFDWSRLPPHLGELIMTNGACLVPAALFFQAPLSRLTKLFLPLVEITDEVVPKMPQSLTHFDGALEHTINAELTPASLPYWPYNLRPINFPLYVYEAYESLEARRKKALVSSNTELIAELFPPRH